MAIRLSDLRRKTRSVTVHYQGEDVNVEYYVNAVTPEFLLSSNEPLDQIKRVVASWDVQDDDGNNLAPAEIADKLPIAFLNAVISAIIEDMTLSVTQKN
jgi:hypothetical protein